MTRRAFTLVEAIVVVAIMLTLAGLLWPAVSAAAKRGEVREPARTVRLETVQHDGHLWVMSSAAYTVPAIFHHHPDCPCHIRKAESEAE